MKKISSYIIPRKYEILLGLMMTVFLVLFLTVSLSRHLRIGSYYFDLGIMHQTVSNTSHGHILEMTDPNFYYQSHRLGYHFDPILAMIAPLYVLWDDARILIIVQVCVIVLGAAAIYLLGIHHLRKKIYALGLALCYLLYFPIQLTLTADFHSVTLATSLLLWSFYFAEKNQFKTSFFFIFIAWLTKENVPLVTAGMGAYYIYQGKKKFGISILLSSVLWFLLVFKIVMPYFRVGGNHFAEGYYSTDLMVNIGRLFSLASIKYLFYLLRPLLFVPLLAPQILLIALSEWLINLLSSNGNMRLLQYHYTALLSPFIFIALLYSVKKIKYKAIVIVLLCVSCGFFAYKEGILLRKSTPDVSKLRVINEWQEKLKDRNLPVSTTGHLAPYFSGRRYFYHFLYDEAHGYQGISDAQIFTLAGHYEKATFVLIQKSEIHLDDKKIMYHYNHLTSNPTYKKIFEDEGIEVYKKL